MDRVKVAKIPSYHSHCGLSDHIAIPDFAAGAMENWGLITYLMRSVLYNPRESSEHDKQWVALVVSHELAHQVTWHIVAFDHLLLVHMELAN